MFEGSLVESTSVIRQRNRWPVFISVGLQAALAIALLSIPLLHPEVMSLYAPQLTLFAPVPKPPQSPPPPQRVRVVATETAATVPMTAPTPAAARILRGGRPDPSALSDAPPTTIGLGMETGPAVPFSMNPGSGSGPVVVAAPAARSKPLSISSGVTAGLLLAPITPVYPTIAKATHTEGTVVVEAIISKTGAIESAHAVSGPAMLQGAALDAVKRARYHPYLLNNEPTEVQTTISINFRMNS